MSRPVIAFQGEPGAYSEAAAYEYFGAEIDTLPCANFEKIFDAVNEGTATQGMIPIENSLAGSIHRNYDLLLRHDLFITGEYHLRVSHCLMALPGVELGDVTRVLSHPQALAQCEGSLAELGVERVAEYDTAGSARLIKTRDDRSAAALASKHAASVYALNILKENMEDNPANFTRFLAISKAENGGEASPDTDYKTSIVFSLENQPGILFKALSVFALREIDLTKIESRPLTGKPWEYYFYIDFAGHIQTKVCRAALNHLDEIAPFIRVLGSYKRHVNLNVTN
ncbi:MAG: prephenate dehydratase [Anaerolineales bacterium]|nr:prephenate dehydratase [Anaerolineales bacterium]